MSKNKVQRIIDEQFDSRLSGMLAAYMIENGFATCREITDEAIKNAEGNAMFSTRVIQEMAATARRIANEVNITEFTKWIQMELNPCMAQPYDIWKDDYTESTWNEICAELDIDENETCVNGWFLRYED